MTKMFVRMSHGAPVVILFVVVFGTVWTGEPTFLGIVGASLFFFVGLALRARAWRIADTPITKARAATVGECEFTGIARSPAPEPAPASGISCAWFHWALQRYHGGKNSHWETVESRKFDSGFWLVDSSGEIWISCANATYDGLQEFKYPVTGRPGRWREVEHRIPEQGDVYVLGPVEPAGDRLVVACDSNSDRDFIISDDTKSTVARRFATWAWLSLGLGALAAFLAPLVTATTYTSPSGKTAHDFHLDGNPRTAFVALAIFAVALWLSWFGRIYNRLVILRVQAEKAWASIEVQLQRRHDLIENLVTVVQKYAQYERTTFVSVAAARRLPTENELHAAVQNDAAQRAEGAHLVGLAESMPQLHADAEFTRLSQALTDAENRIALARSFYNDAVTELRDRRGTMPYVVVAWLVPVPSLALFGNGTASPSAASEVGVHLG